MSGIGLQAGMMRRAAGYDADAQAWFTAVEAVSSISSANKTAVNAFIVGCKADGIWTAIKASCLLCAANDLTGALVPLVGAAPTTTAFVSGDYSRTTGLKGDGSTKQLNSNRAGNADPQNSFHAALWIHTATTLDVTRFYLGTATISRNIQALNATTIRENVNHAGSTNRTETPTTTTGLIGVNRSGASAVNSRFNGNAYSNTLASTVPNSGNVFVFSRGTAAVGVDSRISFYSIGEALNLALLDARLATLMAALT